MLILFRMVLVLAAAVFVVSLLVAGAFAALGYTLWCVLRGQRPRWPRWPTVFMGPLSHMRRRSWANGVQRGLRPSPVDAGVVEGQARELT